MTKKYTKLDNKNMAIVETKEITKIVNIKAVQDEKKQVEEIYQKAMIELDEILNKFAEKN